MDKETLTARIKDLPAKEQILLNLFYVDNLDFKQIAEVLSISVPEVEERIRHARSRLDYLT